MNDPLKAALDRVAELEEMLGARPDISLRRVFGKGWPLGGDGIIGLLLARNVVTRAAAHVLIYGGRPEVDQPELKIIDVFVSRIRKLLQPHGIVIKTAWAVGYYLDDANKAKLRALIEAHK